MTSYVITSDANFFDATFSTRTGDDTYTLASTSGANITFTIDGDVRYGPNTSTTTGSVGSISTYRYYKNGTVLFDASNVRLIPYDTGAGNVPAADTIISQGGITAKLLGVWSAINSAPTAAGSPLPATGYILLHLP